MDKKQGLAEFMRRVNEPPEMTDALIRHKWPEEKPERRGRYLCCMEDTAGYKQFDTARWGYVNGNGMSGQTWVGDHWSDGDIYEYEILDVKYWWELPEV